MVTGRVLLTVGATFAFVALLLFGRPMIGSDVAVAAAPSASKIWHAPMCYDSTACVSATATQSADGGTVAISTGKWYRLTATGDGSGGVVGCLLAESQPTTCTGARFDVIEGRESVGFSSPDGGSTTALFFLSSTTSTMTVKLCPEVPCR